MEDDCVLLEANSYDSGQLGKSNECLLTWMAWSHRRTVDDPSALT